MRNGEEILFKASCDSSEAAGLKITYPVDEYGTKNTKNFIFKDAHRNDLSGQTDLFIVGSYVKAVLDTKNSIAYIQNADTNGYLERRLGTLESNIKSTETFVATVSTTWTGTKAPFTQTIAVEGMTETTKVVADVLLSDDYEASQTELENYNKIYRISTAADQITVHASEKTEVELSIKLLVMDSSNAAEPM